MENTNIKNSYSTMTTKGSKKVGGLVRRNEILSAKEYVYNRKNNRDK